MMLQSSDGKKKKKKEEKTTKNSRLKNQGKSFPSCSRDGGRGLLNYEEDTV